MTSALLGALPSHAPGSRLALVAPRRPSAFAGRLHVRKSVPHNQAGAEPLPPSRRQQAVSLPPVSPPSTRRAYLKSRMKDRMQLIGMFLFCAALALWAGNYTYFCWALIFILIVLPAPL